MVQRMFLTLALVLSWSTLAAAQNPVTADSTFQVRAVTSLQKKDAIVLSNTGASGSDLCASAYAFEAQDGQLLNCCSCSLPRNALRSIPIAADLLENDKPPSKSVVLALLASLPVAGTCSASVPEPLSIGMAAWKGEAPFTPATLSATQLATLQTECGLVHPTARTCGACPTPPM